MRRSSWRTHYGSKMSSRCGSARDEVCGQDGLSGQSEAISFGFEATYHLGMSRHVTFVCIACLAVAALEVEAEDRVASGIVVLYDFEEGAGTTIRDRSEAAHPLDLRIETPRVVRWNSGAIVVDGSGMIASATPATRIVDAISKSG